MKTVCLTPQEIEKALVEKKIQPTAQRIAICRYVLCEADHPTADQVKEWADKNFPKISLATVYNTLNILVEAGLLLEVKLDHTDKVMYDNNIVHHHHFLDEESGKLFDIDPADIEVSANLKKKFKIRDIKLVLRGRVTQ